MGKYNTDTNMKPYQGFIIAVVGILCLIFIGGPLQYRFGSVGVVLTEVLMAAIAMISVFLFRGRFKAVFPIKKVKLRQIAGVIILWIGTYLTAILGTAVIGMLFPEKIAESGEAINSILGSLNFAASIFVIALMPAVCEEMIMRGAILSSFRTFRNKWLIIILVGIIFGIYHLDAAKLFSTAVLGMTLAYIVIETDNILLSMFFHFINNAFAVVLSFIIFGNELPSVIENAEEISAAGQASLSLSAVGLYLFIAAAIPFIIFIGSRLLHGSEENRERDEYLKENRKINPVYIAAIMTAALFISGFVVFSMGVGSIALNNPF